MATRDAVLVALFAAIMAVLGLIPKIDLALGAPLTAQNLGLMLAGSILGARRGAMAVLLFIVLVAAGLPLLSGARGGLGWFTGASGGFLLAWPLAAAVIGYLIERQWDRLSWFRAWLANLSGGIVVLYLFGVPWMGLVTDMGLAKAMVVMLAYIPGDILKSALAATVAMQVRAAWPLITSPATQSKQSISTGGNA